MAYNEDDYRIEEYTPKRSDETFYQIRFKDLSQPLTAIVTKDNEKKRFETEEEAHKIAKKEIKRRE